MKLPRPRSAVACAAHHDFALIALGGDFEAIGHRVALDDERMITRGDKRIAMPTKRVLPLLLNRRGSCVHHAVIAHTSGQTHADALVAETDAEHGHFLPNVRMTSFDNPDSRGEHGPGDTRMRSGFSARIWPSVTSSLRRTCNSPATREILHEVVGERIVIVL